MKKKSLLLLSATMFLATATTLFARTWTDAASGRTLEGDYVTSDATHVVVKSGEKTLKIAITRLSEADQAFIKSQLTTPAAPENGTPADKGETESSSAGPLARLTPPVSVNPHPIEGEGKQRKAGLEVTNNSDKNISKLVVQMLFLDPDGSVGKDVPHTQSGFFGAPGGILDKGKTFLVKVDSFFMEDDTASVDGMVTEVEWEDGTVWPTWTGPAPEPEGDIPVAARMIGVLGEGEGAQPVVALFNLGTKDIATAMYSIAYLDAEGKTLDWSNYGNSSGESIVDAGKGAAFAGGSKGPPEGTVDAKVNISLLIFTDESKWQPAK